jgi:hypothetical protein
MTVPFPVPVYDSKIRRTVWALRVIAPAIAVSNIFCGWLAYRHGSAFNLEFDALLFEINAIMAWMDWFYFNLNPKEHIPCLAIYFDARGIPHPTSSFPNVHRSIAPRNRWSRKRRPLAR